MGSLIEDKPHHSTIYSVWRKVEKYWDEIQPNHHSFGPDAFLKPLDALLTEVFLGYCMNKATVTDLAWSQTGGILSVVALSSEKIKKVSSQPTPSIEDSVNRQSFEAFIGIYNFKSKWKLNSDLDKNNPIPNQINRLILTHIDHPGFFNSTIPVIKDDCSTIFLIYGLGNPGQCSALDNFIPLVNEEKDLGFVLARDLGIGFHESGLGILYHKKNCDAGLILDRIRMNYASNFEMEDMIRLAQSHWQSDQEQGSKARPIANPNKGKENIFSRMKMKIRGMVSRNN